MGDSDDELKAQKKRIEAKVAWGKTEKIMDELEGRKWILSGIDEETWEEIFAAINDIVLGRKTEQESFQDAVRNDPDMTPEQKARWLAS